MSETWFTADPHFGHRLVAGQRGFGEDIQAHDQEIVDSWEATVAEEDVVWVLGDLTANDRLVRHMLDVVFDLPGRKRLITGNHDPVHPMHSTAHKWTSMFIETFEFVAPYAVIKLEGARVHLSHFPYADQPGADRDVLRYAEYRLPYVGPLLHGHTHLADQVAHGMQYHVGWDAHRKLVPLGVIATWVKTLSDEKVARDE